MQFKCSRGIPSSVMTFFKTLFQGMKLLKKIMTHFLQCKNRSDLKYRIYCNKRPGAMHFPKGGATITDKQNHISSPVAMGDNGHLLP